MNSRAQKYDVAIVGGGPSGASAAIHLALGGARVLLAESARFPRPKLCGEFISPECLAHFARLGIEKEMACAGGARIDETIFYTRAGRRAVVPSAWFGGAGEETHALGLSRAEMDARLLRRARAVGVEVVEEAQAVGLLRDEGCVRGVRLHRRGETKERHALLTIDATGRARALARFAGKESREQLKRKRAPLVAFKAHLEGARVAEGACEIYFYRGGYGGLSSIEKGLSNLCFIVRASDVRACASDPKRVMREALMKNARAAQTLKSARVSSAWLSVALEGFGRREPAPARGLLAVGDAASFIDPFTGSGMLMALESGELAAQSVLNWINGKVKREADGASLDDLAREYHTRYESRFGSRLRLCGWLRRAAFAPAPFVEMAAFLLGASANARRGLARSTRSSADSTA